VSVQAKQPEAEPAPIKPESLTQVVEQAGLQWVQTKADVSQAEPEIEPVVAKPVRKRKPRTQVANEPLQMVETAADKLNSPE
jgi:ribonuclease E